MTLAEPFFKISIDTEGLKYRVVMNGADIKGDVTLYPFKIEIPVNQYITSGQNEFEVHLFPLSKKGNLAKSESAFISCELRLYTDINNYVILSKLQYSESSAALKTPFLGSSEANQYKLIENTLKPSDGGDYIRSKLDIAINKDSYNETLIHQQINFPAPFPRWKFLDGDAIPDPDSFETEEELDKNLITSPFNILKTIHAALSKKNIESIMPLFKERNEEMDKAFYYKPGTHEKMLSEAIEEDFEKGLILDDIDMQYAWPDISASYKLLGLGADPLIGFHNKSESVFQSYPIYFRKEGDKWIITR